MTFISYAQNFEDVLLWRALGHVKNGFYIDVGANDPVEHSVTKAFYDAGWRGISVEPLPSYHQAFLDQRPRDVNLAVAAGAREGELTLYDVPAVRGWASPERAVAEAHRAEGYELAELTVPVRTLAAICAEYVTGPIHFLKIDVEGFEGEVLQGMDFERWRPWVLVIEATLPNSRETNHETWEPLVTSERYRFAWFDGLNRYYVAAEHPQLLDAFGVQPNVFDAFISYHLEQAWAANKAAREVATGLEQRVARSDELRAWSDEMRARSEDLRAISEERRAESEQRLNAAEQRGERLAQTTQQALQHARELLDRYNRARDRAGQAEVERERLRLDLANAAARGDALQQRLDQLHADAQHVSLWAQELEQRVIALQSSNSWRISAPLRSLGSAARALRRPHLARRVVRRLTASERVRRAVIPVLLRFPWLRVRVSEALTAIKDTPAAPPPELAAIPEELRALPASVRSVLADLRRARGHQAGT
jgi:FkbM family methyltransferase